MGPKGDALIEMKYDYSYSCECGMEDGAYGSQRAALAVATEHARTDPKCGVRNPIVFIDQYDLKEGELSGSYIKKQIATPAKK